MELENIIKRTDEDSQQVLVDFPVIVEEKKEEATSQTKRIPWRLILYAIVGVLAILVVVILIVTVKGAPDLEVNAPTEEETTITLTRTEEPSVTMPTGTSEELEYKNEEQGFSIVSPAGWQMDKSGKTGAMVVFLNPVAKVIGDVSYATLISVEKHEVGEISLADQLKASKENTLRAFPDFIFDNDSFFNLKGRPYYLIGGTYTKNSVKMKTRSLLTIYEGAGYAITASGPLVTWSDNEAVISKSQFSFELL